MAAGSVKDTTESAERARTEVHQAETQLATGGSIGFEALHKLRDRWRHADLAAQGAQAQADSQRQAARLDGLGAVGAEIDKAAATDPGKALEQALAEVAAACTRVRRLAAEHDAGVAALVAAALDLAVEPKAPAGPRSTSGHVAVEGRTVVHGRTQLRPVRDKVETALSWAVAGDVARAAEVARPVVDVAPVQRPDMVLRGRNGLLQPMVGPLNSGMQALLRSGEVTALSEVEVDRWMSGELA